jgi:hypothetical protein
MMEVWWIVVGVLVLALLGMLYAVLQRRSKQMERRDATATTADRDGAPERETSRPGPMRAEDPAWQPASQAQDRATRKQKPPAP